MRICRVASKPSIVGMLQSIRMRSKRCSRAGRANRAVSGAFHRATERLQHRMDTGALSGLVSPYYMVGQFTAHKAEQILVAKIPAKDVPIETLKRFSFQVRMEAAEKLKLPPPLSLFNYA